ncbi:MAG TPA: hypothetical protein VGM96_03320 [Reyranella sp.]|jgi:hypothetical protein
MIATGFDGESEMSIRGKLSFAAALIAVTSAAQAADPRCDRPPYGGSPDRYRAVLEAYKQDLAQVAKTLEEICRMKFDGADRASLYKLQYKDEDINRMDTEALALDMLKRKNLHPN